MADFNEVIECSLRLNTPVGCTICPVFEGIAAFEARRFEAAEQPFAAALEAVPGRISTHINLAAPLRKLARPQQALTHAHAALAVEGDSSDAWLHHATALLANNR